MDQAQPTLPQVLPPAKREPIKPRLTRCKQACDRCHLKGTKCVDSKEGCDTCVAFRVPCTFLRPVKKRGKVPKIQCKVARSPMQGPRSIISNQSPQVKGERSSPLQISHHARINNDQAVIGVELANVNFSDTSSPSAGTQMHLSRGSFAAQDTSCMANQPFGMADPELGFGNHLPVDLPGNGSVPFHTTMTGMAYSAYSSEVGHGIFFPSTTILASAEMPPMNDPSYTDMLNSCM